MAIITSQQQFWIIGKYKITKDIFIAHDNKKIVKQLQIKKQMVFRKQHIKSILLTDKHHKHLLATDKI